jgi:cation diffusion facilitator family transporter
MADRDGASGLAQQRTALISVGAAIFLVAVKLITGLVTGSLGLLAEAAHSGTDFVAALLTLAAIRVAVRPADQEHHYGHGKAEHLAALAESTFLMVVSALLGYQAVDRLVAGSTHHVETTWWAFLVMAVVIAVDAARALSSLRASRRYESAALASNALHFASDLAGSVAVLAGLVFAAAGEPRADAIAALIVAVIVLFAAARLASESIQVLMDRASVEADEAISRALARVSEPVDVRRVRIRHASGRTFVDLVVAVRPDAALTQAHTIADAIEDAVRDELPGADVLVHVEPGAFEGDLRERATVAALTIPDVREVHNVRLMHLEDGYELSLHVKLPRGLSLAEAHASVERLEQAIQAELPEVRTVHAHIEPLSETDFASTPAREEVADAQEAIQDVVRRYTGQPATAVRFRDGDRGRVALISVLLPPDQPLPSAHRRAGDIEEAVRERCPELAEVIVHTEPAPSTSGAPG